MMIPDGTTFYKLNNGMTEDDVNRVFAEGGEDAVNALPWVLLSNDMVGESQGVGRVESLGD